MSEQTETGSADADTGHWLLTPLNEDKSKAEAETDEPTQEDELEAAPDEGQAADHEAEAEPTPDETEEGEEAVEAEAPDMVEVFEDGEWITVERDEARSSFMRQADYTRKRQADAETAKELEAERTQVGQEREQLKGLLTEWAINEPADPDWPHLARTMDPREFVQLQADHAQAKKRAGEAKQILAAMQQQEANERDAREYAKTLEAFPAWEDEKVRNAEIKGIHKAALDAGFSQAEFEALDDHRYFKVLAKAAAYDKQRAATDATAKKVAQTPKALKPGSTKPKSVQAEERRKAAARRLREKKGDDGSFQDWLLS